MIGFIDWTPLQIGYPPFNPGDWTETLPSDSTDVLIVVPPIIETPEMIRERERQEFFDALKRVVPVFLLIVGLVYFSRENS